MRSRLLFSIAAAAVLVASDPARAQVPPSAGRPFGTDEDPAPGAPLPRDRIVMRLDYAPAEGCLDDQVVRASISAQVRRWDPFAPNAPWRLSVNIARRGAAYEGGAELRDVTGNVAWARVLAPRARCSDLVEDLADTLALKINPPAPAPAPVQPGPPAPLPAPRPDAAMPPAPVTEPPSRASLRIGVGTWMDLATAPRPAFGLTADIGFRVAWFSLAGEMRWDPPAGATGASGADVGTSLVLGALVPCAHVRWFAGCLVGELGQLRGQVLTARVMPDHQTLLYGAGGVRLGVEIPVYGEHLFVRLAANLLGAPVRPRLRLTLPGKAPETEWESPAFTGGFGAGLVAAF